MQWLILPILAVTGACIFYQDIKTRMVTWFLFPLIAVNGILYSVHYTDSLTALLKNTGINIGFIFIQFLLLKIVYSFKKGDSSQLIGKSIGWGDLMFLTACTFFFSPFNFILFYSASLVFVLISHLVYRTVKKHKNNFETVPMAGFQSIFLFIYILANVTMNNNLTNDDWLILYLTY